MRGSLLQKYIVVFFIAVFSPTFLIADTVDDIRQQINDHNSQITELNKEITQYQKQLDSVSNKKKTLQGSLTQLDISRKKVTANISVTKNKIAATELEIQQLQQGISSTQNVIDKDSAGLGEAIRLMGEKDTISMAASLFASENVSSAWKDSDALGILQDAISHRIETLSSQKKLLADSKVQREEKQANLAAQNKNLVAQKGSLDAVRVSQSNLLVQTKSQESEYQKLIAQKKAQEASFEDALADLQGKLQYAVKQSQITAAGSGILHWPVDNVRITQKFGNTSFSASGAYNGKGHNGIDLAASVGAPIRAARGGVVLGTGNTDQVRGCYSFGKWVLLKHDNGLDTIYAHLSQISVYGGESVNVGDVLGYSGETGYATGPHLHFGVYVGEATQIMRLGDATKSKTPCSGATMPVAPLSGYLNPANNL